MSIDDLIAISIGRFGLSILEAERLSNREFAILLKAQQVKEKDIERRLAVQSWYNQTVKGTKQRGKKQVPLFEKFSDFYDVEEEFYSLFIEKKESVKEKRKLSMADRNRLLQERKKGGKT